MKAARLLSSYPGPFVARAWDAFCGATIYDLLFLVAKFPLVGEMWRGYADTCTDL
jgi:hypothetical protein